MQHEWMEHAILYGTEMEWGVVSGTTKKQEIYKFLQVSQNNQSI